MHILQIIYTTMEDGQRLANFPLTDGDILQSKESLIKFAKNALQAYFSFVSDWPKDISDKMRLPEGLTIAPQLAKLSCCIIMDKKLHAPLLPEWYDEANGKIYFEDLNPGAPRPF